MSESASQISRKVYFFRIAHFDQVADKLEKAVSEIEKLPFNDQGRYLPTAGDTVHSVFVDSPKYPIKLQLARIRRSDLPLIEEGGIVSALNISRGAGIMDWCHVIIYPDGHAVAEFNRDAPRIAALGEYLLFKTAGTLQSSIKFLPIFRSSVLEELKNFLYVSQLEVEALTTEADAIKKGDAHIGAAFAACAEMGQVKKAKFVLKTSASPKVDLKGVAYSLFSNPFSRESLTKLRIHGRSDKAAKPLDLLQEYLIKTETFMRVDARSRAINSSHAFQVLHSTYENERANIRISPTIDGLK